MTAELRQACPDHENFADLKSKCVSCSPPATTPTAILECLYQPDIFVYNGELYLIAGVHLPTERKLDQQIVTDHELDLLGFVSLDNGM